MESEIKNTLKNVDVSGSYAGRDNIKNIYNIILYQETEREFVVTHNVNIKPVYYFAGRETELQKLRQRIEEGRKSVLISGMGGIGKTQICRKLFEEYYNRQDKKELFSHIGYIEYNGDMGSSLMNCLRYKEQDNPELNQEAAWRELEDLALKGELLLFVDNVNRSMREDSGLQRLSHIPCAVLVTSRRVSFGDEFEPYKIGFLDVEQCKEIYEKIRFENSGRKVKLEEVQDLEYIIENLAGMHTLTVQLLAHLAWTKHWTVQRLRKELEENGFRLKFHKNGELINIQESYEKLYDLSELSGAEQNILEAFSVFPYIPLEVGICNQWLLSDAGVDEDDDILTGLYQKGWLQFDLEQEGYSLHPVFAQFIYEKMKPSVEMHLELMEACQKCLKIPDSGSALECQKFIPFAEKMIEKLDIGKDIMQTSFMVAVANLLYYVAEYQKAEELYEKNLRISERVVGEEHPFTTVICNSLANVYEKRGKYRKAKELYEKNLRISERVVGEEHPFTATSYHDLAGLYLRQGEYQKARELFEKSLSIRERVLGGEHPSIVTSYDSLAQVYWQQGEYQKARELFEKSLHIRKRVLGEEHLKTATSYHNLAYVYARQEEYQKAEELFEKSLHIRERVLGEEHPETATIYHNLAGLYDRQGKHQKAKGLYEKALRIRQKVLGEEHPETALNYNNLAGLYLRQGEYQKAGELFEKSLSIRERVLGEEHPETVTIYNNLAAMYTVQGEYQKAEELYKKILRIYEQSFGKDNLNTAFVYNNLACVYRNQEEYKTALTYYQKAYKILLFIRGLNHSKNTQIIYDNMKSAYFEWNPEGNFDQWLKEKIKE